MTQFEIILSVVIIALVIGGVMVYNYVSWKKGLESLDLAQALEKVALLEQLNQELYAGFNSAYQDVVKLDAEKQELEQKCAELSAHLEEVEASWESSYEDVVKDVKNKGYLVCA